MIVTIVTVIIVLGFLVFIHELGHFLAAKAVGVKVERFSLGLPPKMVGKQIGETEYLLSWIPLGGYVKLYGDTPEEDGDIPEDQQHRSLSHKPAWARLLIFAAGSLFNIIFAFLAFWILFTAQGVYFSAPVIGQFQEDMPAIESGLQKGDKIVAIDGQVVKYWDEVPGLIEKNSDPDVEIMVDRNGRTLTFQITPKLVPVSNLFGESKPLPRIGIINSGEMIVEKIGPFEAVYYGWARVWDLTELTVLTVVKIFEGKVSPKTLGGPIFIAQLTGQQVRMGLPNLFFLVALISLNLGILNLLPMPVLDGGHIFFVILEIIFRRPVSLNIRERAQQVGVVFLIMFMVFLIYNDVSRILTKSGPGQQGPQQEQSESEPQPGNN